MAQHSSCDAAVSSIRSGERVFIHSVAAAPAPDRSHDGAGG